MKEYTWLKDLMSIKCTKWFFNGHYQGAIGHLIYWFSYHIQYLIWGSTLSEQLSTNYTKCFVNGLNDKVSSFYYTNIFCNSAKEVQPLISNSFIPKIQRQNLLPVYSGLYSERNFNCAPWYESLLKQPKRWSPQMRQCRNRERGQRTLQERRTDPPLKF